MAHLLEVIVLAADAETLLGVGARCQGALSLPRKMSLNWFMPALVNIRVGSFLTTIGADGTMAWPFDAKKSRNFCLVSLEVIFLQINIEPQK